MEKLKKYYLPDMQRAIDILMETAEEQRKAIETLRGQVTELGGQICIDTDRDLYAMIWAIDARLYCEETKDIASFEISRKFLEEIYEKLKELREIKQSVKFKELVDDASAESAGADAGRCADVFDVQRQPGDSD